jgi:polyphosphate glucokinase
MQALGIDIGGSGVKGAPVDVMTGELLGERYRLPTPVPATPNAVIGAIVEIVQHFDWSGPIGCGYPGIVKHGVTYTAANVDATWVGYDLQQGLERITQGSAQVINDADAAGIAEMEFGAGRGRRGMVMIITLGTGIGVSAFIDGRLIPNLELGHIEIEGRDAESRASVAARDREELSWKKWAKRLDRYFATLESLMSPDLFIIGGGVSKDWEKFVPLFDMVTVEIVPATLRNNAGIVGAAMAAYEMGRLNTVGQTNS